jgi:exopolyphosphatase/pppGpp-phosphohydrolase
MNDSYVKRAVKRIMAIDLGTNSFHAVIVDIFPDGSFYIVDKLKEMVLLAEKGVGEGLSEAAMQRGLEALKKIKTLSDHQDSNLILAYATSAIREAENGGVFIQRAIDEIGIKIYAIPGRLEAELIGLAVQHGVQMPEDPALIMDIGGGSVEYILADKKKFYYLTSKKIGVARMTASFIDHDPITGEEIKTLRNFFHEKRIELLPAGLVLVHYILKTFGIDIVKISSQALREGIILRYIKKEMDEIQGLEVVDDPRRRSVLELVYKCDWDEGHSRHVAKLSLRLFDALKKELNLSETDRELLEYAALMHDIGYHISHRKHHKHALYIIRNADLLGFKEIEIDIMANVSRYHRRSTPKARHPFYNQLSKSSKERVKKLSAILRVADGLDRSHYQNVRTLDVEITGNQTIIKIGTESDPQLEIWGATRKKSLFEEVTGRELLIKRNKGI